MQNERPSTWQHSAPPAISSDLTQPGLLLIHFWADWNAYDRHYEPVIRAVLAESHYSLQFRSCDVDRPSIELDLSWGRLSPPALVLLRDRHHIATWIGKLSADILRSKLASAIP